MGAGSICLITFEVVSPCKASLLLLEKIDQNSVIHFENYTNKQIQKNYENGYFRVKVVNGIDNIN